MPSLLLTVAEGNGNPLQYSCLENSVDRGVWWAPVYGVAQSRTRSKQLQQQQQQLLTVRGAHQAAGILIPI